MPLCVTVFLCHAYTFGDLNLDRPLVIHYYALLRVQPNSLFAPTQEECARL